MRPQFKLLNIMTDTCWILRLMLVLAQGHFLPQLTQLHPVLSSGVHSELPHLRVKRPFQILVTHSIVPKHSLTTRPTPVSPG